MQLPININDLLTARTVESERLEFKTGWNPQDILHTLCAFANDIHNLGGGYIIIGVAEEDGRPVLPPQGLQPEQLDALQKEIVQLGHRLVPYYHPVIDPAEVEGKHVLVLWAIGGQTRPYKAPVSLAKDNKEYAYYIRKGSVTLRAKGEDEKELISLAATVPFDDRRHHTATLDNLDLGLIRAYLKQVGSDLFSSAAQMNFLELCRRMNLVDGPDEFAQPKNVALMFFNEEPWRFFPYTQIDIVHFPDDLGGDSFTETTYKGPLHLMLKEALSHLRSHLILEKVIKYPDRAEADRIFNYAYGALEEALCNAVYHRTYELREPVEVRIFPDCVTINSFPGPDRSILDRDIAAYRFVSRRYRNRRIGEFLKELDMTEGMGTGVPKILRHIKRNGSPLPVFHTDPERSYLLVEFPIHNAFLEPSTEIQAQNRSSSDQVVTKYRPSSDQVESGYSQEMQALVKVLKSEMTREEVQIQLHLKHNHYFRLHYLNPALAQGLIEMTLPDKPRSSKQKYRLTTQGKALQAQLKESQHD